MNVKELPTRLQEAIPLLQAIITQERKNGCPEAVEGLIERALRRWRGYDRRSKRNKEKSLEHRIIDLEKGLIETCPIPEHYDPGCIHYLAESFAKVLFRATVED